MFFFFFKQKTAYEMRISDWSSDVCSSDLDVAPDGKYAEPPSPERHAERRHGIEHTEELDAHVPVHHVLAQPQPVARIRPHPVELRHFRRIADVLRTQQPAAGDHAGDAARGEGAARKAHQIDPVARPVLPDDLGIALDDPFADSGPERTLEQLDDAAAERGGAYAGIGADGGEHPLGAMRLTGGGRRVRADAGLVPRDLRLVAHQLAIELPAVGGRDRKSVV